MNVKRTVRKKAKRGQPGQVVWGSSKDARTLMARSVGPFALGRRRNLSGKSPTGKERREGPYIVDFKDDAAGGKRVLTTTRRGLHETEPKLGTIMKVPDMHGQYKDEVPSKKKGKKN